MREYKLTPEQAKLVNSVVQSHMHALKNWTASAVENNKLEYAQQLVKQLRKYEVIQASTNVESHEITDSLK